ncbi:MAG: tripartite tricarboxylate transporter TctB family protein [Thiolinea sp.]
MTTRTAELLMAIIMAFFSAYLMWKSAELPIGWLKDRGPGGGAFPFWLATGMLLCCGWIIVNWIKKSTPQSKDETPFLDREAARLFLYGAGSLTAMTGLIYFIGVYGSVPLFMIFYMRVMGDHRWGLTLLIALVMPVILFFFFEVALTITLPKGHLEPLFYPLYDLFL